MAGIRGGDGFFVLFPRGEYVSGLGGLGRASRYRERLRDSGRWRRLSRDRCPLCNRWVA